LIKLTEFHLRRIIKEEVARVMKSRGSSRLNEGPKYLPDGMTPDDLGGYDEDYLDDGGPRMSTDDEPEDEDMLGAYLAVYEHESESVSVEAMARALKSMGLGTFTPEEVEEMISMNDNSPLTVNPNTGLVKERGDDNFSSSLGDFDDERESNAPTGDVRYPRR